MFCWRKFEICQFHDQIIDGFECFCKVIKFKKHEAKIENDKQHQTNFKQWCD